MGRPARARAGAHERVMSEARVMLVCRAVRTRNIVPGTVFHLRCHRCGHTVGVAPSGQAVLARHANAEIVCNECWTPQPDDELNLAPGAIEEIIRLWPRTQT